MKVPTKKALRTAHVEPDDVKKLLSLINGRISREIFSRIALLVIFYARKNKAAIR